MAKKKKRKPSLVSWMIHGFPRRTKEEFKALCAKEDISVKEGLSYVLEDWMANFKLTKAKMRKDPR